jgi:ubiquinone/menaquinone biosynthesis C-methylase UbiE
MGSIKSLQRKRIKEGGRMASQKRINKNCQLQAAWVWPVQVEKKIKSYIKGYSINICSGLSSLGDVKIDLQPQLLAVQKVDMNALPFPDNTFDTVISDPPWKLNFFKRQKPFFEAVRVCKSGGRIIYNCCWRPVSKFVKLEKAIIRTDNTWANVSVIWIFIKK